MQKKSILKEKAMKKYTIEITETLQKQVSVVANSYEEAERKIKELYINTDISLDENNYIDTSYQFIKEEKIKNELER